MPSNLEFPELELKELLKELKYVFLGKEKTYPVIISTELQKEQKNKLIKLLKEHKSAFGWNVADLKGISPSICTNRMYLEEDAKPIRQMQRHLNPNM